MNQLCKFLTIFILKGLIKNQQKNKFFENNLSSHIVIKSERKINRFMMLG